MCISPSVLNILIRPLPFFFVKQNVVSKYFMAQKHLNMANCPDPDQTQREPSDMGLRC